MNRIGLLIPSTNTTMEPDFYRMAPTGVTIHSERMLLKDVTPESLEMMASDAGRAAELLATAQVDVMVYGCTSGSLIKGVEWEAELIRGIQDASKVPALSTAGAVIDALRALDVKTIVVITPYTDRINHQEKAFLEAYGFDVASIRGLGILDNQAIGRVNPSTVAKLINYPVDAECIFISCTNLPVLPLIQVIEETEDTLVVTSNQASMWAALKKLGCSGVNGFGVLLRDLD